MMLYIDADILIYRVAYGCEGLDLLEAVEAMDSLIKTIIDKFPKEDPILVLSPKGVTFRHAIAVTQPYKGNRAKREKPQYYSELRQYLMEEKGAVMADDGLEADDYIGIHTIRKTDIICTIDKDLYMIPAKAHYNFVKDEMKKIKRPAYYFWKQMIVGDSTDNIKGITGLGEKKAEKLLDKLRTKEMRHAVEEEYKREFGDGWKQRFEENGHLLWILRDKKKKFYHYV